MVIMVFKISRLSLVVNMRVWSFAYSGFSTFDILVSIYTHFFFSFYVDLRIQLYFSDE